MVFHAIVPGRNYQMARELCPLLKKWYAALLNYMCCHSLTLGTWEIAQAARIPTHNGKLATSSIRHMMLEPLGKSYYWHMHQRTQDINGDFGYGFYSNERR